MALEPYEQEEMEMDVIQNGISVKYLAIAGGVLVALIVGINWLIRR
tara:strand:+ start:100 stop:237 length:138 start_codon:yes stop_codon:yes gene_type:complete